MLTVQRCTGDFVAGSDDAGRFGVLFANKKSARLTNDPLKEAEVIKQQEKREVYNLNDVLRLST